PPAPTRNCSAASTVRKSRRSCATASVVAPAIASGSCRTPRGPISSTRRAVRGSPREGRQAAPTTSFHTEEENVVRQFKRRRFLKTSVGLAAGAAAGPLIWVKDAHAQQWNNTPEKGAKLRVLRWSRFVQGDIDQYLKNVQKFQDKYQVEVRVDNEGWEDVRPKAAVAANTNAGPD